MTGLQTWWHHETINVDKYSLQLKNLSTKYRFSFFEKLKPQKVIVHVLLFSGTNKLVPVIRKIHDL